jgi:hypothetical protein
MASAEKSGQVFMIQGPKEAGLVVSFRSMRSASDALELGREAKGLPAGSGREIHGKFLGNPWEIHGNSCNFPWKSWVENMDFMIGSGQSDDWYIHMKFEAETCWVILKQGAPGPHSCDFSGKQQESHDVWVSSN